MSCQTPRTRERPGDHSRALFKQKLCRKIGSKIPLLGKRPPISSPLHPQYASDGVSMLRALDLAETFLLNLHMIVPFSDFRHGHDLAPSYNLYKRSLIPRTKGYVKAFHPQSTSPCRKPLSLPSLQPPSSPQQPSYLSTSNRSLRKQYADIPNHLHSCGI